LEGGVGTLGMGLEEAWREIGGGGNLLKRKKEKILDFQNGNF
jgi:hypothetical protein